MSNKSLIQAYKLVTRTILKELDLENVYKRGITMTKANTIISVVIPVYNEIANIESFHNELFTTLMGYKKPFEIIYIDDNSTDGTYEWLKTVSSSSIHAIKKHGIKGKAYSLTQGFAAAKGNVFVMIDGDLQYPPAKIPALIDALKDHDIAVANRTDYKDSKMRKFLSRSFRKVFGKMLFGLDTDIQSGLKAFTREVYEIVKFEPDSPWTFDLQFLSSARESGFTVANVPITFAKRLNGESKMDVVKQSVEIGSNAIALKMKKKEFVAVKPAEGTMAGAGVNHARKKYVTHTTLPLHLSAIQTFTLQQKMFYIGFPIAAIIALIAFPLPVARFAVGALSILYFVDALFNIIVVGRSMKNDYEIHVDDDELAQLDEATLPIYSILCPLYKEAHVVPQFLEAITKLDYPKEKLDVMFLLEEDDTETIQAFGQMTLPYYARTVIVPDSQPKTKPKACNYGLAFAKGKYLVIFDGEDIPDPLQLKKAIIGFNKSPDNVKCLQAKLSYYNSRHNLLTRFFTAEYALWFDVTLPGLQSLNSALPLGGTSNHFETANLRELEGWDPFNVTEDADLGVRLFQKGYRTAIIDSTTYEEATSVTKNWLRQRSRWLKGYMQTYLVHTRSLTSFTKQKGLFHNFVFQLTVGGKILFVLLNPFMWIITALYFGAHSIFGPTMEAIYQAPVSYLAVFSWIFGNFMFLYCYMLAVTKRKQWDLTKYIFLIPIYWFLMSMAALVALYQLITKPHYWEKTLHGFHLGRKEDEVTVAAAPAPVRAPAPVVRPAFVTMPSEVTAEPVVTAGISMPSFSFPKFNLPSFTLPKSKKGLAFIVNILPMMALLNLDLALAYFMLPTPQAQLYLMISLIGKGAFVISQFGSSLLTSLTTHNKSARNKFYKLVFLTFLFNWLGFIAFGLEGDIVIPALFGEALKPAIGYMQFYMFALLCFGMANRFNTYYLKKQNYTYTIISLFTIFLQIPLLAFNHDTILDFVRTFAYLGSINLFFLVLIQMAKPYAGVMENNIASLFSIFEKTAPHKAWKENRMKILIFNWRDTKHVYAGGAEVYVQELAKRWVANGNKVTIFCGNDNNNAAYEQLHGIEIYRRGGTYTVYLFAMIYYMLKFRGKYDVIIDCENGIPFFMPLIAREQVILLIHHVHQEIFRKFLKFPLANIAELLEGKVMPFIYQNKNVVTVSPSSQKDIFNLGFTKSGNIEIIPNGVDSNLFVQHPKTDHPSYIYLGRLKEYKNVHIAIHAFAKLVQVHKNATLSIVGTGESYPALKRLTTKLGIDDSVTFHGRVTDEEKARMLARSWAAIQPSLMEGWGITVIEANAAGTPVIASRVSGLQDSVVDGRTGLLVPAGEVPHFAIAMKKIADDDMLRMNLSQNAQEWARNFNWDKSAENFYSLIGKSFGQGVLRPMYTDVRYSTAEKGSNNA